MSTQIELSGEDAMVAFGQSLGEACREQGAVIFLQGNLGMGKTTLSRGVLKAFGHNGSVKSPTYTLVEPYPFDGINVYHFDLYRLGDPEELEYIGIRDFFEQGRCLCLVEWPDKGKGFLPQPDIVVRIEVNPAVDGRIITLEPKTSIGETIVLATLATRR